MHVEMASYLRTPVLFCEWRRICIHLFCACRNDVISKDTCFMPVEMTSFLRTLHFLRMQKWHHIYRHFYFCAWKNDVMSTETCFCMWGMTSLADKLFTSTCAFESFNLILIVYRDTYFEKKKNFEKAFKLIISVIARIINASIYVIRLSLRLLQITSALIILAIGATPSKNC